MTVGTGAAAAQAWRDRFKEMAGLVAGCFPRRETRQTFREMTEAMLMGVARANCQLLAEALGHGGPHRLWHFLARAVWDHDAVRDRAARWIAAQLADDQAVLVVDETGDEKSSTDAAGAARQYSGALGGIGLCQVAVHLTYASRPGQARRPGPVPDPGLGSGRRTPRADRSPGRAGVRDQAPTGRHDA